MQDSDQLRRGVEVDVMAGAGDLDVMSVAEERHAPADLLGILAQRRGVEATASPHELVDLAGRDQEHRAFRPTEPLLRDLGRRRQPQRVDLGSHLYCRPPWGCAWVPSSTNLRARAGSSRGWNRRYRLVASSRSAIGRPWPPPRSSPSTASRVRSCFSSESGSGIFIGGPMPSMLTTPRGTSGKTPAYWLTICPPRL